MSCLLGRTYELDEQLVKDERQLTNEISRKDAYDACGRDGSITKNLTSYAAKSSCGE